MPSFADQVLEYLWSKHSDDRKHALHDLAARGLFGLGPIGQNTNQRPLSAEEGQKIVEDYLAENPRGFCDEGIQRFKTALHLGTPRTALLAIKVTVPDAWDTTRDEGDWQLFLEDSRINERLSAALHNHLVGSDFGDPGEEGKYKILSAEVTGCVYAD